MKSVLVALFKAAVTGILFFLIFRQVHLADLTATLRNARFDVLVLAFLVLWIGHSLCVFRWRLLMLPLMPTPSVPKLFGFFCIGLFFNLAFPTVIGGDVVKMYYAGKPSGRFAQSFAATFLDRDTGMLAMMLIAVAATLVHPVHLVGVPIPLIIWGAFVLFVAVNVLIFAPSLHQPFVALLRRVSFERPAARIDTISLVFQTIWRHRGTLLASLLISLLNQLLVISVTWLASFGLRMTVPLPYFLVIVPVITLISMIPISLNGMGLREYAYVTLLGSMGVDREASVALGLLSSAITILSAIPGGIVYLFFRNRADIEQIVRLESNLT